jgi:hypothetical protein
MPVYPGASVEQQRHHHRRVIRRSAAPVLTVGDIERVEIHLADGVNHEPREVPCRQPLSDFGRHQKRLLAITCDEALTHHRMVLNPPDDPATYATASPQRGSRRRRTRLASPDNSPTALRDALRLGALGRGRRRVARVGPRASHRMGTRCPAGAGESARYRRTGHFDGDRRVKSRWWCTSAIASGPPGECGLSGFDEERMRTVEARCRASRVSAAARCSSWRCRSSRPRGFWAR